MILEISFCPANKKNGQNTVRLVGPGPHFAIKLEFSYKVLVTATTHVKVMDFSKSHPVKIKVVRVSHYTSYFFSTINVYQKH